MAPTLVVVAMGMVTAALAESAVAMAVLAETAMAMVEPAEMAAAMLGACPQFLRTGTAK